MKNQYTITGTVLETITRQPLPGLRVEAWDKDLIFDDLVGSAVTDAEGKFTISFTEGYFSELFFDRKPDLFFRVFFDETKVLDTHGHVLWNVKSKNKTIELLVDGASVNLPGTGTTPPATTPDPGMPLHELGNVLQLDPKLIEQLKAREIVVDDANEATLLGLVNDKVITAAQKTELQLATGIARISGENPDMIKALKPLVTQSPVQLINWDKADWLKILQDKKVKLPAGERDMDSYAENLRSTVEQSFPSAYFLHRVINGDAREKTGALVNTIAPLFENNSAIIPDDARDTIDYEWKNISDKNKQTILTGIDQLLPLAQTYRALGVAEILNQPDRSAAQKQGTIEKRFSALATFYRNNPYIELPQADFVTSHSETRRDNWNWSGIAEDDQPYVKKQMAATQRAFNMSSDHATADVLMKKGYDSAYKITSASEASFIERSGLGWEKGHAVYAKANQMAIGSAHYFEAIRDAVRGPFGNIAMSNQDPRLVNDLKEIDGYAELFGNQDYCDCEECKSILSPAAYFTDLMHFVGEHVSKNVFLPSHATHPLYLKRRRPDLWTLKLSCQNTNTEIPYLQVVNEVLEAYLKQALPTTDVYEMLRAANWSCRQPFNLILEEVRLYLSHFDLRLAGIYKTLNEPVAKQHREHLKLSHEEMEIIAEANPAGTHKRFGNKALAGFNVQDFLRYAGITRAELDDLLRTTFAPALAAIHVQMHKVGTDIQKYYEDINGLTLANLDVLHRYLRLWKKTNYTLREFDLVLNAMKAAGMVATLEELDATNHPKFLQLAQIIALQARLSCSAEEMATILHHLPLIAIIDNQQPLYRRLFDLEKIFNTTNVNAATTTTLSADPAKDKITPLILAGLGISESELIMLFKLLGIDTSADITVDIQLLSLLYRNALVARGLKLDIEDFIHLRLMVTGGASISLPDTIETLADAADRQKASPFSVSEMWLIIAGQESSDLLFANEIHTASAAVQQIQASVLSDKKLPTDLLAAFLQSTFNLTADQLANDFLKHITPADLSSPAITKALNAKFTNGNPDTPADLSALIYLLQRLERFTLLFSKNEIDAEMISFLVQHPDVAGISNFGAMDYTQFVNIQHYHTLFADRDALRPGLFLALQQVQSSGTFTAAENTTLAEAWGQPDSLVTSLTAALDVQLPALAAIPYVHTCLEICVTLGIQGDAFVKLKQADMPGLESARNIVLGAFSSKYPDEAVRNEKSTPYTDKLNTLKRNALCDYIISRSDIFKFNDRNDLYNVFLLDVEMSGCFRTSYLVAAITSVQLYVHRCLINLEQSDKNLNPSIPDIHVSPTLIPADEWEWRKNYRVWEANRKVFLYPENYIEPALRDNKTEIFRELEDELLQQKITQDEAEAAYKKYLAQFSELTRLRYAGGFYHHISSGQGLLDITPDGLGGLLILLFMDAIEAELDSDESKFHLFARTNVHPYQYYHRTYNHHKKVWTSWKTIDLGIEAAEISAIIFQGKLYIYWTESQGKELNKISGGDTKSAGMVFKTYVKYSFLDENGKWSAPQRLYTGHNHVSDNTLFGRVWEGSYPDDDTREKTHDTTVEKFQELVFRKPYAFSTNDIAKPIELQHIWSHSKSETKVKYTTGALHKKDNGFTVDVPSATFTITNDDFTGAKVDTTATITMAYFVFTFPATITLNSSCSFRVKVPYFGYTVDAGISKQQELKGGSIKTTVTQVSLSRNVVTNPHNDDMLNHSSDLGDSPSMKREYGVAFSENDNIGYYVENGRESLSNHSVHQTPENDALLYIENLDSGAYDTLPLSTILTDTLSDLLFAKGVKEFLSLKTQYLTDTSGQQLDFKGAYGDYYWELFFHVPFLIADHLNANQKFKEAKWWYERIFDPTSEEQPDDKKPTDHNWQFREFRNLDIQKLKDILLDQNTIEAYKTDPFNPHAIARLRLSAYQKTIVMHYIDNLLDWGDYLFMQDTRESINEAEMLYQLAFDILGKRPIKVGKCETADEDTLTYAAIEPQFGNGSEFLILLENYYHMQQQTYGYDKQLAAISKALDAITDKKTKAPKRFGDIAEKAAYVSIHDQIVKMTQHSQQAAQRTDANAAQRLDANATMLQTDPYAAHVMSYKTTRAKKSKARENTMQWQDAQQYVFSAAGDKRLQVKPSRLQPGHDLVKQYSLVFCVPQNSDLMRYWNRVEDRLFKIRNCMNISGIRRSLSLFQPPIDPMLLVRARAAGLSLEDITAMLAAGSKLPAYRFTYLIEKAKQITQTVQSFGSALLSALEKKDGEDLLLLRTVHEKNILKLTRTVKKNQLQEAQQQYKAADAALANVQNRVDYYQGLIDTGLIAWEVTEQVSKWTASGIKIGEATLEFLSSAFGFMPQVGSPFAMKYGGVELHSGMKTLAAATGTLATIADNIAILAGLEASHQRREQDWKQQLKLAQQEFKQSTLQLLAADLRQQIAEQDLAIHEKNMEQSDEIMDFYKNKFTNLGLYNYMASTLNRLYRDAYNIAYDLAKQAETAYRFERFDNEIYIQADNWQFDRAGLLAGERLMLQINQLEKKFIDANTRQPEITQTFSLAMLSPAQLLNLRQNGNCTINIPEIAFELLYPGQYRRVIKSVRMTIPCVAGQYTNISARLTLTQGQIEQEDKAPLTELLVAKYASISTSSANNDSGVFDLNFRDERYLPFEGAGAISDWTLELPTNFRAFNYDTISDVLLHISYTASEGNRSDAENALAALVNGYALNPGFYRLISLRYEFPEALHQLFSQDNQTASFDITAAHFPYMLSSKTLTMVSGCMVYVKPKKGKKAAVPGTVKVNTITVDWSGTGNNIPSGASVNDQIKGGTLNLLTSPKGQWTIDAGNKGIEKDTTEDVLILIRYKAS